MRAFYKSIKLLKDILEADINVHTVTHGLRSLTDVNKQNIFPLAHLQVISSTTDNNAISFTFEVAVIDIRNISKEIPTDKFLSNDNELDNLNTCHAVINRLITTLKNTQNADSIEMTGIPNVQPIIFEDVNLVDGWRTEIELIIPNNEISIC